jgi:hypothetical protein
MELFLVIMRREDFQVASGVHERVLRLKSDRKTREVMLRCTLATRQRVRAEGSSSKAILRHVVASSVY